MAHSLIERMHNPRGRTCGCEPDCWCQSTMIGRLLRWYSPKKWHHPVSPEWKRSQA
jgi:hypothetical protein